MSIQYVRLQKPFETTTCIGNVFIDINQRWDDSDSGIGIGIGIGTFSMWAESESELNRLLNFQLESVSELESPLPGIGFGIDRFQLSFFPMVLNDKNTKKR